MTTVARSADGSQLGGPADERRPTPGCDAELLEEFERFQRGELPADDLDHRAHVRLAFVAVSRYEFDTALARYAAALRCACARDGAPEKFHMTVTVAFLAVIAERQSLAADVRWPAFAAANPDLFDRECLEQWYTRETLASATARATFVLPTPRRMAQGVEAVHPREPRTVR